MDSLFIRFAGSCGVDLTMCNGTAIYFHDRFHVSIASAGAIAFLYGISSIYARGIGGYVSDALGDAFSLKGRLVAQMVLMILQGLVCVWFAQLETFGSSIVVMFVFSILIQVSQCV
jgi:NNP family nitrate/nitrite transporter-like MFS transporter